MTPQGLSLQEKAVVPGEMAEGSRPWGSIRAVKNCLGARMATASWRTVAFLFSILNSFSFSFPCDSFYNLQPLCKSITHNSFDWGVLWGWTEMLPQGGVGQQLQALWLAIKNRLQWREGWSMSHPTTRMDMMWPLFIQNTFEEGEPERKAGGKLLPTEERAVLAGDTRKLG